MVLCCLIPLAIAGILLWMGFRTYAVWLVILLCPIMHFFMMKDMHSKEEKAQSNGEHKGDGGLKHEH